MGSDLEARIRHVTAVLGPTNTGKTHLAIERMLGHESGMIGLPLRLLAREIYDKVAARVGIDKVALITGEEKIRPERARYWIATVEAMPRDIDVDFLAVDEIQLCADPERGHVFTDRLLHARGRQETFLLGAQTMREAISDLIPGANFISRPRLSKLTYSGEKKITRLPTRSAVVAFSASEVYAIAELIRRQRGGAAVVLGALSPRTRNAQVALYQSGDVDFLVATDAVGMGLNLDVDHVAFAAVRKFDGQNHRNLTPSELGQIAGRAGRHMNDGTFGVTGGVPPLDNDLIERLENHTFDSVKVLQWRSRELSFSSVDALRDSLRELPREARLTRARMADDVEALEALSRDPEVMDLARGPAAVALLWDVCQVPDYRKISSSSHAELIGTLYKSLRSGDERIPEDWFAKQVAFADRTDGDIDTLANRIAHIRTWTFVANRADWLKDPGHWQGRTRAIEDQLSDALHECLTQRFVDRRTSALMKGMRDKEELNAEIREDGAIEVENHFVGRLRGFRFTADTSAEGIHGKATRHAAAQVLSRELGMRARRVAAAKMDAFKLRRDGRILWRDDEIARLEPSEDPLKPSVVLLADEHLSGPDREKVQARLDQWIVEIVGDKLKPLVDLAKAEDLSGLARGIAFRLTEGFGILKRETVAEEIRSLDQVARAGLRKYGVRFGAFHIHVPLLLKPAAAELTLALWALKHAGEHGLSLDALPEPPRPGLTSVTADAAIPDAFYRAYGFHRCGPRAVRVDILERLADLIRPLLAWRASSQAGTPPNGATGDGGFTLIPEMMSILGCSQEELGEVLKALGFWVERKTVPKPAATAPPAAATVAPSAASAQDAAGEHAPGEPIAEGPTEIDVAAATAVTHAEGEAAPTPAGAAADAAAAPAADTPPEEGAAPESIAAADAAGEQVAREAGRLLGQESGDAAQSGASEPAPAPRQEPDHGTETEPEPAPAEAQATDAGATDAGATDAGVTDAEVTGQPLAEPQTIVIDIWRPRRHRSERPAQQGERRRGRRGGGGRQGERTGHPQQPAPGDAAPAAASSPAEQASEGAAAEAGARQGDSGRGERRDRRPEDRDRRGGEGRGDRPRNERRADQRSGGPARAGDREAQRGEHRRGDDRRRREDSRKPQVISAGPRRGGAADPDSPFAALGALKEALEKKSKEKSP